MKKECFLTIVITVGVLLSLPMVQADIQLSRNGDWLASDLVTDPNGHGTQWDPGTMAWTYYTKWVEPGDATVYPGPDYNPAELMQMQYQPTKTSYYDPVSAITSNNGHIPFEYETFGSLDHLYVFWNDITQQTGGYPTQVDFDAPYGKQQWCVAVFTNPFPFDITVDLSGASEIQTAAKGSLDGTKVEIATVNTAFDSKTVLWSYEFSTSSPYIDGVWAEFVTSHVFGDFLLESGVQDIVLAAGESLAFGLRAGNLEGTGQYLRTKWVDDEVTLTISSNEPLTLTVATNPAGNEGATTGAGSYSLGDEAVISAFDFNDCANGVVYVFDHWEGEVADANAAQTTVSMGSSTAVTAVYAATAQCGDACHPVPAGSVDGDCDVDLDDANQLAAGWLDSSL